MKITHKDIHSTPRYVRDIEFLKDNFPNGLDTKDIEGKEIRTDSIHLYDCYRMIARKFRVACTLLWVGSDGCWEKRTYDKNGNETYFEDSDGYWNKRKYDENGSETYYEDSNGYWEKRKYDENGNETYFETSDSYWR